MRNAWWSKLLRIVGIVLMSLAAVVTLMGGAGTTCVALNPTGFGGKFSGIASYQWLWILFVLVGIAAGVMGIRAVVLLIKGSSRAWRDSVIALVIGTLLNIVHLVMSRALRGSSMPVDGVLYMNVLTLVVFFLFRIPGIWQGVNFEKPSGGRPSGTAPAAFALWAAGLLTLTIQFIMQPTHTIDGINYADAWHLTLSIIGGGLLISGLLILLLPRLIATRRQNLSAPAKTYQA